MNDFHEDTEETAAPVVECELEFSEGVNEIFAALAKAQGAMTHPVKNKTAKVKTKAGHEYSYSYSSLADTIDAVRAPLSANGICFVQATRTGRGFVSTMTLLGHTSGQWMKSTIRLPVIEQTPQAYGSAVTYTRRYGLPGICGIASDDDDDGNLAQGNNAQTAPRQRATAAPALSPAQRKVLDALTPLGVRLPQLEAYVRLPLPKWGPDEIDGLRHLYAQLRAGKAKAADVGRTLIAPHVSGAPPAEGGEPQDVGDEGAAAVDELLSAEA